MMTRRNLRGWAKSEYNENTPEQLDYYINERKCDVGDPAYLYEYENKELCEMQIVHIVCRSDNTEHYDNLIENDDVLLDGETDYKADTSAEFITDNDCYLVWFRYV